MAGVEYRVLAEAEIPEMARLQSDVYVLPLAQTRRWQAVMSSADERPVPLGAFEEGRLVSGLMVHAYQVRLGCQTVPMGGVGGVATQPEHRSRRHVARLLALALEEMRRKGQLVSMLYPFSYAFYRRYGWEHAGDVLRLKLPMTSLAALRAAGAGVPPEVAASRARAGQDEFVRIPIPPPDEGTTGRREMGWLAAVYEAASAPYNCVVVRHREWDGLAQRIQHQIADGTNVYVYAGRRGDRPVSYVVYSFVPGREDRSLRIAEAFAIDAPALESLLAFLARHDSQAEEVVWNAPTDSAVRDLLAEPGLGELHPRFMLRVVDVEALVRAMRVDGAGAGEAQRRWLNGSFPFTLSVRDPVAPWNDGTFRIDAREDGAATAEPVTSPGVGADVACDITALSAVASGYLPAARARALGRLAVRRPEALKALAMLFPARPTFCADHF